ncbi:hypothetical protein BO99DRAFT_431774 [Aspergillus violaceofuscus CBS 115571]|uniref:Uncharacterized protein n=1 Tax=Aspergillus violaceofuscus (strain CBS 115571) TaxID=1450538 RepID=A0A2V5HET9_ASPV1|nr:hypothetical protein BO99DRAFT_431774 [Aspergillus violaceofuscus CBS 115571]
MFASITVQPASAVASHLTYWRSIGESSGSCLALNRHDDLVFLHTEGYHLGYIQRNSAPGGVHFDSRQSSAQLMVLGPGEHFTAECSRDDMVEWARRWNGYEVTGDEKEYYMALIQAAEEGNGEEI